MEELLWIRAREQSAVTQTAQVPTCPSTVQLLSRRGSPNLPPQTFPASAGPFTHIPTTVCLRVQSHRWPYDGGTLLSTEERCHPPLGQICWPTGDGSAIASAGPQPHKYRQPADGLQNKVHKVPPS